MTIQTSRYGRKSLASVIGPSQEARIGIHEQLRLATRLARSVVLQYHSTPWRSRDWTLDGISYFDIDKELSTSLATLHVSADLRPKSNENLEMTRVFGSLPISPPSEEEEKEARIRDDPKHATLYRLGVAIFQINRAMGTLGCNQGGASAAGRREAIAVWTKVRPSHVKMLEL